MQAKSMAGLADVAVKANGGGTTAADVERLRGSLAAVTADIHAGLAAKRAMSAGVPADRAEVLTDPAKFYATMIAQAAGGGGDESGIAKEEIEQAIKYQAQRAQLGDLGFVLQALVGNMMQLQVMGAKMQARAEVSSSGATDLMQKAGKFYTDAAKVACSIAGLVRSGQT